MFAHPTKLRTLIGIIVLVYLQGCSLLDPYAKKDDVPAITDPDPVITSPTQPEQPYTPPPYTDPVVVDTPTTPVPTVPSTPSYDTTTYHHVQAGENLYRIGLIYGVTTNDLLRWNPGINPSDLRIGQRLAVSGSPASSTSPVVTYPVDTTPTTPDFGYDNPTPTAPVVTTPPPTIGVNYHTVQAGETLYRISKMYGITVQQLQAWNGGISPSSLSIGQRLVVSAGSPSAPVISTPAPSNTGSSHTVQRGDTLYNISRRYGMSVDQLASLNGLYPPYPALSIGQRLTISGGGSSNVAAPSTTTTQYHTVQAGETLYRISKMYNITVQQLQAWNGGISPSSLSVGQRLVVSSGSGLAAQSAYYYSSNTYTPTPPPPVTNNYSLLSSTRLKPVTTPQAPLAVKSPSYHIVENSETLSSIAKKYDVTTHELAIWNGIGTPYTVFPGQKLLIP
ncbi:LysM peptidoglycan-binding domain-containing protein [Candidatus Albibeggiatoa sp. nov. NOAA]|uniref:muramidase family protein n=1 Tax=Candidatus Albibeggiatoa sp. nov. NOAA TaxID=3162724 RepID=UPI003303939E|nr:LysM peptidoglycan-binding domain-containing protein [Thiotrichaceae bacterium]